MGEIKKIDISLITNQDFQKYFVDKQEDQATEENESVFEDEKTSITNQYTEQKNF